MNRDLRLLGMAPQYNSVTEMTLNVEVHDYYDIHYVYLSDDENRFQLAVPIDTIKNMVNMVWRQLDDYEHLLPKGNKPQWKFVHDFLPCHDEDPDEDSVFLREERKADELTKALTELYSPKK